MSWGRLVRIQISDLIRVPLLQRAFIFKRRWAIRVIKKDFDPTYSHRVMTRERDDVSRSRTAF